MRGFHDVSRAIGIFGTVDAKRIDGWMLSTDDARLDSFRLFVDGVSTGACAAHPEPETPPPPHARGVVTRFAFDGPFPLRNFSRVDAIACVGGQPVARMATRVRDDLASMPAPPVPLMMRVAGCADALPFKLAGLRRAADVLDALSRHRPIDSVHRLLDWGCGTGRVTAHLIDVLRVFPALRVEGADLDREAIRWAAENVRKDAFTVVKPRPPLPWPDGTFDTVLACSVFPGLDREAQTAWLAETRRVLAPGGLLLASAGTPGQTRASTMATWPEWLDVAEYIVNGMEGLEDLVVLRRRWP